MKENKKEKKGKKRKSRVEWRSLPMVSPFPLLYLLKISCSTDSSFQSQPFLELVILGEYKMRDGHVTSRFGSARTGLVRLSSKRLELESSRELELEQTKGGESLTIASVLILSGRILTNSISNCTRIA